MIKRYDRNILVDEIGEEGQKKLLDSKVLIAGAGGLGSTVIANLTALGIGTLGIIDKDILEITNYNRQYIHKIQNLGKEKVLSAKEWIEGFNPATIVNTYNFELTQENYKEIVKDYDLIIDCFDSYKSKFLLNKIAVLSNKPLIHGGITEFCGQVTTIVPKETACLNCLFPEPDLQTAVPKGVISSAVTTIASIEATEAIKILLNIGKPLKNELLTFNALSMDFRKVKINRSKNCPLCKD